jgi:hypothetical protein
MLVKIPAVAGELLPEVVELILRLIVPGKIHSVYFGFDLHDKLGLISRFPQEIFDLASASIELREPPPYDLVKFLDEVIVAAPDLRDNARYVALRNRLQQFWIEFSASATKLRMTGNHVRRDKAALFQRVQAPPGEPPQPEATGVGMEETKCLKPPDSGHEFGWLRECAGRNASERWANLTWRRSGQGTASGQHR